PHSQGRRGRPHRRRRPAQRRRRPARRRHRHRRRTPPEPRAQGVRADGPDHRGGGLTVARKRMIHPDFFTSATMNALPVTTMVTFAGIWTWADDYGRGEWAPELVKAAVWPRRRSMTEAKVEQAMTQLVDAGVLCQYVVAGHVLLHVTSWSEFQQVSHP